MPRSPLIAKLQPAPAQLVNWYGWEIPASYGSVETEYWALKRGAGLMDLSHRGRILVRGKDAPRFLHGMVTNEVQGLKPGQGNYAFLLDVHGHILADLRIFRLEQETFLLDCEPQLSEVILAALDRHIISDMVELEDCRDQFACLSLEGPSAREVLSRVVGHATGQASDFDLPEMNLLDHIYRDDMSVRIVHASLSGRAGYWILASPERVVEFWGSSLAESTTANQTSTHSPVTASVGVQPAGFEALEICRIEAGIPRYGIDITEKNLPQETGQTQAISFTKGCYIGQEVVERIRSRGHVNRKLVRLLFEGRQEVPPQTEIFSDGQPAGITASSVYSFGLQRTVGLGYLRREFADAGKQVMVGTLPAEIAELSLASPAAVG